MKLTNPGLPEEVYQAICKANEDYDRGESDYTATEILKPPYMVKLARENHEKMVVSALGKFEAWAGTAIHKWLEDTYKERHGYLTEVRMYADFDLGMATVKLGGMADLIEKSDEAVFIRDYKYTKAGSSFFAKPDWYSQGNILSYLYYKNTGVIPTEIQFIPIYKDWDRNRAKTDERYPQLPSAYYDVPVRDPGEVEEYIKDLLAKHVTASMAPLDMVEPCTKEQRWDRGRGPLRCLEWCDVGECGLCPWFEEHKEEQKNKHNPNGPWKSE